MKRGFTLIELSIVLIIIGLLVGGVLAGRELIEQAKIRAQIQQIKDYQTAASVFLLKYDGVPGDLDNGVAYGIQDDDGNGDGRIGGGSSGDELYQVFLALSSAGLVDGTYAVDELPTMILSPNGFIGAHYHSNTAVTGNVWIVGFELDAAGSDGYGATAEQTFAIDMKIDDGLPSSGKMLLMNFNDDWSSVSEMANYFAGSEPSEGCADDTDFTAMTEYDLTHADTDCTFIVPLYP